jgi:hypothetical protein
LPRTAPTPGKDFGTGAALNGILAVAARREREYIVYSILSEAAEVYAENGVLHISADDDYGVKKLTEKTEFFERILADRNVKFRAHRYIAPVDPNGEIIKELRELSGGILEVV